MPPYLDRDITGDDSDVFPGGEVLYAVVRLTALGGDVREGDAHSGQILRAGWVTFGDSLSVIGGVPLDYWREPIYLNFETVLWTPVPSTADPNALGLVSSRVKWHLSLGTSGHIYVFGA